MITVEYTCEDGTVLPVHFADEAQAAATWRIDREHGRDPRTPLGAALDHLGVPGARRAYDELDLVIPPAFDTTPDAKGFPYFAAAPMTAEQLQVMTEGCGALVVKHGSALGIWQDHCLPGTKAAWAELEAAPDDAPLDHLAELAAYGQQLTMIPAYVCGNDLSLLAAVLQPLYSEQSTLVAYELAQGFDNPTLDADQRLWHVAQLARDDTAVVEALAAGDPPAAMRSVRASGQAPAFFAAVDAFLDDFGLRAEGWDIACPTWREQRAGFWAQVAQLSSGTTPEPRAASAAAAERRVALVEEITERLAGDETALGRFQRRLARIEPYVFVREDRALWQVALTGALRSAALRRGDRLVREGRIDDREDVLFLVPDEVAGAVDGDLRVVAAARRAEHEQWCRVAPPREIGGDAVSTASAQASAPPAPGNVHRGVAASRGVVTGTARVIVDLEDADRLEPGDVLVCVMTSPPWTPLFGIAGAVVADTGEIGSHPAIAAREYGIPCVLGVENATRRIPDGSTVTVDGVAGTVTVVGTPA